MPRQPSRVAGFSGGMPGGRFAVGPAPEPAGSRERRAQPRRRDTQNDRKARRDRRGAGTRRVLTDSTGFALGNAGLMGVESLPLVGWPLRGNDRPGFRAGNPWRPNLGHPTEECLGRGHSPGRSPPTVPTLESGLRADAPIASRLIYPTVPAPCASRPDPSRRASPGTRSGPTPPVTVRRRCALDRRGHESG